MRLAALLAVAAVALSSAAAVSAENKAGAPFELVRSLQELQEQAARGNASAPKAQAALMTHISQRLAAAGPETWKDRRNVRAVITYLLSGGAPQAVKTPPEPGTLAKIDETLMKGAYAYALGRGGDALQALSEVDPRTLPSSLGGHVAFVRATLAAKDNLPAAIAMLDLARLLSPGTLVEEAALRREVFIIGPTGDFDKFIQLSRQYLSRFPRSVYADNFLEGFAGSLLQIELADDPARFVKLDAVIGPLPAEVRRELYLQVARAAVARGRIGTARMAAEKAEALSPPGSVEAGRAKLYLAAATIVTEQYGRAVDDLAAIAQTPLTRTDEELREAVTGIAHRLRQWPQAAQAKEPPPGQGVAAGKLARSASTIELAQKSLAGADELLRQRKP